MSDNHISLKTSAAGLWGAPGSYGYDERASEKRFAELVYDCIAEEYPEFGVEVEVGQVDRIDVYCEDCLPEDTIIETVSSIISDVYTEFKWCV